MFGDVQWSFLEDQFDVLIDEDEGQLSQERKPLTLGIPLSQEPDVFQGSVKSPLTPTGEHPTPTAPTGRSGSV